MKKKKTRRKAVIIPITACKGKKGGCLWEGEPEGITKQKAYGYFDGTFAELLTKLKIAA